MKVNISGGTLAETLFQGYRTGDSEITGDMLTRFRVHKDTAQLFANGGIYLVTPEFLARRYYSNHLCGIIDLIRLKLLN